MRQTGKRPQRLQLGSEHQRPRVPRVMERLHAEMIAGEKELAAASVPQREREHAGETSQQFRAPLSPAVDQHFAVAVGGEDVTCRGQLASQLAEVVDLAVEDDGDRTVRGDQRLPAAGKVDDRQPAVPESDRPVAEEAVGVGAAMRERGGHRGQGGARPGIIAQVSGDAAHGVVDVAAPWTRRRQVTIEGTANYSSAAPRFTQAALDRGRACAAPSI